MKKTMIVAAACFLFMLMQGCSSITVLRTREIAAVQDTLKWRLDTLEKRIAAQQDQQQELIRLIRADQQVRFSEVEKAISDLGSNLSESQYRLSKIAENTADFQKEIQKKLASDSAAANGQKTEIEKLFQIATEDFNAGRFEISRNGFQDIASRYPEAPQGQEARFWIGECHYARKAYDDAEAAFLLYVRNYPQGSKSCTALYKLGLCYEKLDKKKSQDLVWKKLLDECPDANEAALVKAWMEEKEKKTRY